MIYAALCSVKFIKHHLNCPRQIQSVSWGTHLVEHNLQAGRLSGIHPGLYSLCSSKGKHSLAEILPELAVEPRCTDNHMVAPGGDNSLLTVKLGKAINSCWGTLLVLPARGIVRLGSKNIICRNLHQQTINLLHCNSKILRSLSIEQLSQFLRTLCPIHIGIGSTVYNCIHPLRGNNCPNRIQICNIQKSCFNTLHLIYIGEDISVIAAAGNNAHLISQLAVGTGNKNIHTTQTRDKGCHYN